MEKIYFYDLINANPQRPKAKAVLREGCENYDNMSLLLWSLDKGYIARDGSPETTKKFMLANLKTIINDHNWRARTHYRGLEGNPPHLYEMVKMNAPAKLFLDIEEKAVKIDGVPQQKIDLDTCERKLKTLLAKLSEFVVRTFGEKLQRNYIELDASNDSKFSRHIIYQCISFKTIDDMKVFMTHFAFSLKNEGETDALSILDMTVYKRHQALRLLYSSKIDANPPRPLRWMENGNVYSNGEFNEERFCQSLITIPDPETIQTLPTSMSCLPRQRDSRDNLRRGGPSERAYEYHGRNPDEFVSACKRYVESKWDQVSNETKETFQYTFEFKGYLENPDYQHQVRIRPAQGHPIKCPFGKEHENNCHAFHFNQNVHLLSYRCHRCGKNKWFGTYRDPDIPPNEDLLTFYETHENLDLDLAHSLHEYLKTIKAKEIVDIPTLDMLTYDPAFECIHRGVKQRVHDRHCVWRSTRDQLKHTASFMVANTETTSAELEIEYQQDRTAKRMYVPDGGLYARAQEKIQFSYLPTPLTNILFSSWYRVHPEHYRLSLWFNWGCNLGISMKSAEALMSDETRESISAFYDHSLTLEQIHEWLEHISALGDPKSFLKIMSPSANPDTLHPIIGDYIRELEQIKTRIYEMDGLSLLFFKYGKDACPGTIMKVVLNYVESATSIMILKHLINSEMIERDTDGFYHFSYLHQELIIRPSASALSPDCITTTVNNFMNGKLPWNHKWVCTEISPSNLSEVQKSLLSTPPTTLSPEEQHSICESLARKAFPAYDNSVHTFSAVQEGIDRLVLFYRLKDSTSSTPFLHKTIYLKEEDVGQKEDTEHIGRCIATETFGVEDKSSECQFEHARYGGLKLGKVRGEAHRPGRTITFVKAPPGSGKSVETRDELIRPIIEAGRNVLSVVPRYSLVKDSKNKSQDDGIPSMTHDEHGDSWKPHQRITTVESLYKFFGNDFEGVFIDEASMILLELTASTFRNHQDRNRALTTLRQKLQKATHCVIADADLDTFCVEMFTEWFTQPENEIEKTSASTDDRGPLSRYVVGVRRANARLHCRNIYFANSLQSKRLRLVDDRSDFMDRLLQSTFVEGVPVVVACTTKNGPEEIQHFLQSKAWESDFVTNLAKYRGKKVEDTREFICEVLNGIVTVCSDNKESEKDSIIDHVDMVQRKKGDEIWEWMRNDSNEMILCKSKCREDRSFSVSLFAYSPVIGVGVSFTTDHFKRLFGYCGKLVGQLHSLFQLLDRFRKFTVAEVYIALSTPHRSEKEFEKWHADAQYRTKEFASPNQESSELSKQWAKLFRYSSKGLYRGRLTKEDFFKAARRSNPFSETSVERNRSLYLLSKEELSKHQGNAKNRSKKRKRDAKNAKLDRHIQEVVEARDLTCMEEELVKNRKRLSGLEREIEKFFWLTNIVRDSTAGLPLNKKQEAWIVSMKDELRFMKDVRYAHLLEITQDVSEMMTKEKENRKSDFRFMNEAASFVIRCEKRPMVGTNGLTSYIKWATEDAKMGRPPVNGWFQTTEPPTDHECRDMFEKLKKRGYAPKKNQGNYLTEWEMNRCSRESVFCACINGLTKLTRKHAGKLFVNKNIRRPKRCKTETTGSQVTLVNLDPKLVHQMEAFLAKDFSGCPEYEMKMEEQDANSTPTSDLPREKVVAPTILARLKHQINSK